MSIDLPISKSIVSRVLMLQAIHGDPLMEVSCDMAEDNALLRAALVQIADTDGSLTLDLANCGTALRFLTAYCACLNGREITLTGSPRLCQRPVGQLVDALLSCGAEITYLGQQGYPPLLIRGTALTAPMSDTVQHAGITLRHPQSSQFVSALLLIGIEAESDIPSPYITMTRQIIKNYHSPHSPFEKDWSSAAFWYEYVALHGGEVVLNGLRRDSVQGDRVVADLFRPLGVDTYYTDSGVRIVRTRRANRLPRVVSFRLCPDLYPAVAIAYRQLGKPLWAVGTESLPFKESDRLRAVREGRTYGDHRIAMALLAADLPCDDNECVRKSYPAFISQLSTLNPKRSTLNTQLIIPRRGINDEGKGKKHALHRLIQVATADYVWLQDDDILPAAAAHEGEINALPPADLYILPLRMQGDGSLLSRLQMAEYAAIQEVTMCTAKRGRAVMCSGANLLVRREAWLDSYPDLHPEIPSGDDMFLLESFRRRGLRIVAVDEEAYTATVTAVPTWRALFRQRMRWAGKAPRYTDPYIIRYGAWVLGLNVAQLLCPAVLLIKFPFEYRLIKKRDPEISFLVALLLECLYPYYVLVCLIGGLFKRDW